MFSKKLLESEVSRHITLGKNALYDLPEILTNLRTGKKNLIITQDSRYLTDEYLPEISQRLEQADFKIESIVVKKPREDLDQYLETIKDFSPKNLILLGDATTIDYGKFLLKTVDQNQRESIEWISIPSTPESDSVCSPFIFLDQNDQGEQFLGQVSTPLAVVADTSLITQAPEKLLSAGIGDLLSRQTSIWDWKLANRLRGEPISDFVVAVSSETIDILKRQLQGMASEHEEATPVIMKALLIAGFLTGFAADLRSCYGSEHMFAQALDAQEPGKSSHGERVGLGTIMMASIQGQDWRKIKESLDQFNLPTTASNVSYKTSSIIKALINAVDFPKGQQFYTILGPGLTEEAAWTLAYRTGIIGERL
ncbi:MAG: Glycerol-1-phosphate dehydrogenase [NAD(P)+] [Candidatus Heimdallarchaeota archaeon LC_3]|nr:MAG: Glycerol-1-phosphate dehydrogenase [NAD(P)+] [Candidatus Heimdallarchaeota archaeon LC_3]